METAAHVYEAFEYDLSLTAEQLQIRDTARRFASEVMRPAGIAIDRMTPEAAIAPDSPLYRVLAQAAELGFTKLGTPAALGGLEASPATAHMVLEELAWGNVGLAGAIFLASLSCRSRDGDRQCRVNRRILSALLQPGGRLDHRMLGDHGARSRLRPAWRDAARSSR